MSLIDALVEVDRTVADQVRRIRPKRGDVLVVRFPEGSSAKAIARKCRALTKGLRLRRAGVHLLGLEQGMKLDRLDARALRRAGYVHKRERPWWRFWR